MWKRDRIALRKVDPCNIILEMDIKREMLGAIQQLGETGVALSTLVSRLPLLCMTLFSPPYLTDYRNPYFCNNMGPKRRA